MVSFFTPDFLFDDIKKKYRFALHETSESLITVSCCRPLQPFHLIIEGILFPCFLTCFMNISSCLPPLVFFLSLYTIFPMSWRYNQDKLPKISNHLPKPFFMFSVSTTALEEAKQASSVIYQNYLIKNFNLLFWASYQSSCSWIWVTQLWTYYLISVK